MTTRPMTTRLTFEALQRAAEKAKNYAAIAALSDAETNANDTVLSDKSASESEWEAIALASIAFTTAFTEDRKVQAWFTRRGYAW